MPSEDEKAGRHVTALPLDLETRLPPGAQNVTAPSSRLLHAHVSGRRPRISASCAASHERRAQLWKMSSGKSAETVTFGTSTTLLIRRSTATLAIT